MGDCDKLAMILPLGLNLSCFFRPGDVTGNSPPPGTFLPRLDSLEFLEVDDDEPIVSS